MNIIEQKLNEIEKQNKQILFLLNLIISESNFAVSAFKSADGKDKYTLSGYQDGIYGGSLDKKTLLEALEKFGNDGIPQNILDEVVSVKSEKRPVKTKVMPNNKSEFIKTWIDNKLDEIEEKENGFYVWKEESAVYSSFDYVPVTRQRYYEIYKERLTAKALEAWEQYEMQKLQNNFTKIR